MSKFKMIIIMELVYFFELYMYRTGSRVLFGLDVRKKQHA